MTDLYVLEWSKKQGMPHVQPLERTLSNNRKAYMDNRAVNDYVPLAVGTLEEMHIAADAIRPTLAARRPEKTIALTL